MSLPRFRAILDFHEGGDATILFEDVVPYSAQDYIYDAINNELPDWDRGCRTVYHLEQFVEETFRRLIRDGLLRKSPVTRTWVWSSDG